MKRTLICLLLVLVLFGGCESIHDPIPIPPTDSSAVVNENDSMPANGVDAGTITVHDEPPVDRTWISPGKVKIGNFHPGDRAEWPLTIHNGRLEHCAFAINYRVPDFVTDGYAMAPEYFGSWIIVADMSPVLAPRETRDILIILDVPRDVVNYPDKWEFWVTCRDLSQTGSVQAEMASRWLVSSTL